jgi:hypothetical protein
MNTPKTTNPAQLFLSAVESSPQSSMTNVDEEEDNDFNNIIRNLTEIKVSLSKWKLLTMN